MDRAIIRLLRSMFAMAACIFVSSRKRNGALQRKMDNKKMGMDWDWLSDNRKVGVSLPLGRVCSDKHSPVAIRPMLGRHEMITMKA